MVLATARPGRIRDGLGRHAGLVAARPGDAVAHIPRCAAGARAVVDRFLELSGPSGARVSLLESDRIALPFTYTGRRPVILLPSEMCDRDGQALRYALAHEWSHVERGDVWAWNLAALAGAVLFYQPLYWWLRRQLRLSQDYLADDRAAAAGSAEDYAACLLRLARRGGRPAGRAVAAALPAMGIFDRPSTLYRRIHMLIGDHGPIERRCPRAWRLGAAAATALTVLAVAGLRAEAPQPISQESDLQQPAPAAKVEPKGQTPRPEESVSGRVETPDGARRAGSRSRRTRSAARSRQARARRA